MLKIIEFQLSNINPFYREGVRSLNLPLSITIPLAVLFFILSIATLSLHGYTRKKIKAFKELQLKEYIKDNPKDKHITYEKAKLYLPSWERMKYNSHFFMAIIFFVAGLVFALGNTLTTL